MPKSVETSSGLSSAAAAPFSHKRYFVNNLDSYHGVYILKHLSKILKRNSMPPPSTATSQVLEEEVVQPPPEQPYEIVGTVLDPRLEHRGLEHVSKIIPKDKVLPNMLSCGTVILDVGCSRDELKIALDYTKLLKDLLERQSSAPPANELDANVAPSKERYLILISTVMTWASTKPLDPSTPDMPFIETDFRKRKTHPNYKLHYDIENEVIGLARKYRSQIGALVVAPGVTYGGREDVLFYWFQKAWECERFLPLLGRGHNAIPLINVEDLAQIIYNLVLDFPKKLYILAVEQNVTKQREIVKPLGRLAGSGMFKCIPPEDAFLIPEIDQRIFDLMTLNLNMEPAYIVETMNLQWISEAPFGENVSALMKEFKKARGLKFFKVIVYGPPLVGKTTLSKMICEAYGLVYVSPDTVVQDIMDDLSWRVSHWETGEAAALDIPATAEEAADPDDEDLEQDEAAQETAKQTLALLKSGKILNEEEILGYLRQRLLCREAQNRGWVLDGFPTKLSQCSQLFEKGDDADSEVEEEIREEPFDEDVDLYSNVLRKLLPDIVVSLEATDDFICEKAMRQPEGNVRLSEETVIRRLKEFRTNDARDVSPLNFFDELDIHPLVIPVKEHTDYDMNKPYADVTLRMGSPCRYAKLMAIIEANEKKVKKEHDILKAREEKLRLELEKKMKEEREEKMEYWSELYALMREEEEAALAAAGEPMRNYLVHHIFPTLTQALLEVAKLRPEDPIDFLAEYLFKLNPTGKMLEPGYNLQGERLLGKIKILDEALKDLDINIEPLIPKELDIDIAPKKNKQVGGMSNM